MRRGTIVATTTALALGAGGAGVATAAPLPITIDFTSGTVKVGQLDAATQSGTTHLVGTIESDTLVATFPADGVTFAPATAGSLKVTPKATGTITGRPNLSTGSLDLSGPLSYAIDGSAGACTLAPAAATSLAGGPLDLGTGAYSASGSVSNATLGLGCAAYLAQAGPLTSTSLSYAGKLTVPGFIPAPTSVTVVPPASTTSTTPTTPTTPATPSTAVRPGRLAVTVSRPATVKRGRSSVTKVVLRNTGAGTARSVTLKVAVSGKGVTPRSTTKTYATVGAGKSRVLNLRLRSTKAAAKRAVVKVTASGAGGLKASASTTFRLR